MPTTIDLAAEFKAVKLELSKLEKREKELRSVLAASARAEGTEGTTETGNTRWVLELESGHVVTCIAMERTSTAWSAMYDEAYKRVNPATQALLDRLKTEHTKPVSYDDVRVKP